MGTPLINTLKKALSFPAGHHQRRQIANEVAEEVHTDSQGAVIIAMISQKPLITTMISDHDRHNQMSQWLVTVFFSFKKGVLWVILL